MIRVLYYNYLKRRLFLTPNIMRNLDHIKKRATAILHVYKTLLLDKKFLIMLIIGYVSYLITIEISNQAGFIATQAASVPLTDIFLSNVPRVDTSFIHANLSYFFFDARVALIFLLLPYAPFAFFSLSLLLMTRAIFINMTNLGIPTDSIPIVSTGTFGGDLFFSGHVAFPFMLALVFWQIKPLRYGFFLVSILFGASALLGHYHYTIDVFAAPFFAYGIFIASKHLFKGAYTYIEGIKL